MSGPSAFGWRMPVAVEFGAGCSNNIASALGERKVLVLAFESARQLGLATRWQEQLGAQWGTQPGAQLVDWVDVKDGVSSSLVYARELSQRVWPLLQDNPDCVLLAVGGGTTMDLAKVLRCRPREGGFDRIAATLRGAAPWPALDLAPLWLAPTTAGTGSEVTRWATVWDTEAEPAVKRSFDEAFGYADRAFVDPALTLSCPAAVTRDCALDTLAHALEALWNRHANPVSDRLAVSAARRVLANLKPCLESPSNLALRSELSLAALEAGMAFSQTRTALAHALSYAVTLEQGVPHGLACAIWLPTAWSLALGRDENIDRRLAEVFDDAPAEGPARLSQWLAGLGVVAQPEAFGIADGPQRIAAAMGSARGGNFIGAAAPQIATRDATQNPAAKQTKREKAGVKCV